MIAAMTSAQSRRLLSCRHMSVGCRYPVDRLYFKEYPADHLAAGMRRLVLRERQGASSAITSWLTYSLEGDTLSINQVHTVVGFRRHRLGLLVLSLLAAICPGVKSIHVQYASAEGVCTIRQAVRTVSEWAGVYLTESIYDQDNQQLRAFLSQAS